MSYEYRAKDFIHTIDPLISKFIEVLKGNEKRVQDAINLIRPEFDGLCASMECVLEKASIEAKSIASDYNIFQILKIERKEVNTHSAFLANLLDAKGSHGQGAIFLDTFLNQIGIIKMPSPWSVETEKSAGFIDVENSESLGRMDIVLQNQNAAVVIENKIDHVDEPNQLWRYGKWLENEYLSVWRADKSHYRLIYLTLDKKKPGSDSISKPAGKAYEKEKFYLNDDNIYRLSYISIYNWLKQCMGDITAPSLKAIIAQYLKTLRRL